MSKEVAGMVQSRRVKGAGKLGFPSTRLQTPRDGLGLAGDGEDEESKDSES